MSPSEPRNPFYFLLLLASLLFVATALAYAVLPVMEQTAAAAGRPPSPSKLKEALLRDGWFWLLWEVAAIFLFGFLSMGLDRLRSLRKERRELGAPVPEPEVHVKGQA